MANSDVIKNIKKLVSNKMKNRSDRISKVGSDLEEAGGVLADYRLYFEGGLDALKASGVDQSVFKTLQMASDTNDAEMKLLEHRINLENELNDEGEDEEEEGDE